MYTQQPIPEEKSDEFVSSAPVEEKSGGIGKKIAKFIGGVLVLSAAAFGLYKWKGANGTWLNKDAEGIVAKMKNWAVKPGEWIDKNIVKNLSEQFGKLRKKGAEVVENAETKAEDIIENAEEVIEAAAEKV